MGKPLKIAGMRFGRLTAVAAVPSDERGRSLWHFVCDCGAVKIARSWNVTRGLVSSCGCKAKEWRGGFKARVTTHGLSKTRTYRIWQGAIQRCMDAGDESHADYGARGIRVCDRWMSFENFLADMGKAPAGLSIDRKDNDGNYEPGNCKWATRAEQSRNTRRTRLITMNGRTQCLTDWAKEMGLSFHAVHKRIKTGYTPEEALLLPANAPRRPRGTVMRNANGTKHG